MSNITVSIDLADFSNLLAAATLGVERAAGYEADYARSWGYGKLVVGNLFAFRSTYPHELKKATEPFGPEIEKHFAKMFAEASIVVAAWGNDGEFMGRAKQFRDYATDNGVMLHYLKLSKKGHPCHPARLRADLLPHKWN